MRAVSDAQVRKLMEEVSKHGRMGVAAMKADMDRKTARKYVAAGRLPSEMPVERTWRTRSDPFAEVWHEVERLLVDVPELETTTVFEHLQELHPGRFHDGQLRTLQRQVRRWRSARGPEQEVVFGQRHRPGEAMQTDFTSTSELGVTIAGGVYEHLLCNSVLPYSNWRWSTVCLSESMAALRSGLQRALFQLGRIPEWHQTDNSTAATHRIPGGKGMPPPAPSCPSSTSPTSPSLPPPPRPFNDEYVALAKHFGMKARTTAVGAKEQNGDVEAGNGVLKRSLTQALLLRGSRDFASVEAWQAFVDDVNRRRNNKRGKRVAEDLAAMRELNVAKLPEYVEQHVLVSEWSTVRVKHCAYSVPSRLIGERVRVRLFEERLEVWFVDELQMSCERLLGRNLHRVDYRHVIWSLVRKPGAFQRYVYREDLFPTVTFRRAYDALQTPHRGTRGNLDYLRILHLAATTMESEVEAALVLLLESGARIDVDAVKALVDPKMSPPVPSLSPPSVDLSAYDRLLEVLA